MKPVLLWAELIQNSSKENETIFDPFLGSGTTLITADQLNRVCYGMEIDPKYCQVIIERYRAYCQEKGKEFVCKINGLPYV
jgi:DNA modification methylase